MHIPERMCVACRKMKPKAELFKVVRTGTGAELDEKQNKSGRGAYVCKDAGCIETARKKKAFSHHFKGRVNDELYNALTDKLKS